MKISWLIFLLNWAQIAVAFYKSPVIKINSSAVLIWDRCNWEAILGRTIISNRYVVDLKVGQEGNTLVCLLKNTHGHGYLAAAINSETDVVETIESPEGRLVWSGEGEPQIRWSNSEIRFADGLSHEAFIVENGRVIDRWAIRSAVNSDLHVKWRANIPGAGQVFSSHHSDQVLFNVNYTNLPDGISSSGPRLAMWYNRWYNSPRIDICNVLTGEVTSLVDSNVKAIDYIEDVEVTTGLVVGIKKSHFGDHTSIYDTNAHRRLRSIPSSRILLFIAPVLGEKIERLNRRKPGTLGA